MKLLRASALALVVCAAAFAQTTAAGLMPMPKPQFFDADGLPLAGGSIYTCVAGTACPGNPLATYTDSSAMTAQTNPIVLDAGGFASPPIWLGPTAYKIVAEDMYGVQQWSVDNITSLASISTSFAKFSQFQIAGQMAGADHCAQITAASALLTATIGSNPGYIIVDNSVTLPLSCATMFTVGPMQTLWFTAGGVYSVSKILELQGGASIMGTPGGPNVAATTPFGTTLRYTGPAAPAAVCPGATGAVFNSVVLAGAVTAIDTLNGGTGGATDGASATITATTGSGAAATCQATYALTDPTTGPTVTPTVTGSTSYSYEIVGRNADGTHTVGSSAGVTSVGPAFLNGSQYMVLDWSATPIAHAPFYDVYRSVGENTQGLIASKVTGTSFNDQNSAGNGQTAPVSNNTVAGIVTGVIVTAAGTLYPQPGGVWEHDTSAGRLMDLSVDCQGIAGCLGVTYDSDNAPSSGATHFENVRVFGAHMGFVSGWASNQTPMAVSAQFPSGTYLACNSLFAQRGCYQSDTLSARHLHVFGGTSDLYAEAFHINSANSSGEVENSSYLGINVGVHVVTTSGPWEFRQNFDGSTVGALKALFVFEASVTYTPKLTSNECESGHYSVIDYSNHGSASNATWDSNQWNEPIYVVGNDSILSTSNGSNATWYNCGASTVISKNEASWATLATQTTGCAAFGSGYQSGHISIDTAGSYTGYGTPLRSINSFVEANADSADAYQVPAQINPGDVASVEGATAGNFWLGYDSLAHIAREPGGAILLSGVAVLGGVSNLGNGVQHMRGAVGCTTAASIGAGCSSGHLSWPTGFSDASYTMACTLEDNPSDTYTGEPVATVESKAAGYFTLSIVALTAVAATADFDCIAFHDN